LDSGVFACGHLVNAGMRKAQLWRVPSLLRILEMFSFLTKGILNLH
jgi:hypothetical protein